MKNKNLDGLHRNAVLTARTKYVNINDCNEITSLNGGEVDASRWDVQEAKVERHRLALTESITNYGYLSAIIGIQAPEDTELFGVIYKKDSWLVIDESGRVRILQDLVKNGYEINPDSKQYKGLVPLLDVTHLILDENNKTITEQDIEKIWNAMNILSTNKMDWSDYGFLSSGSRVITDSEQKDIWTYLANTMKKYYPTLTNKTILAGTINDLTSKMINTRKIPYDLKLTKRYSDAIFQGLLEIRKEHTLRKTKAPFMRALAKYLLSGAKKNGFEASDFDKDYEPIIKTNKTYFKIDDSLIMGSDEHFAAFEFNLGRIIAALCFYETPRGGYTAAESKATKEFKYNIYRYHKKLVNESLI
tara:strand:+ start:198 stop:1277 length:1080 start_codon:yes stop_codon:yes gene_type:complete